MSRRKRARNSPEYTRISQAFADGPSDGVDTEEAGSDRSPRRRAGASAARETAEYTRVARDPGTRERWIRRIPVFVVAVLAVPLLWLSVTFSLEVGSIGYYVFALDGDAGTKIGVVVLTALGFVGLVGTLVFLWLAFVRARTRWPWVTTLLALLCAGALPASFPILGMGG
ncbi:hypothetical protein [Brevibacterium litoralis]|uniref:hypothetical protein n=1 Tax=Brevibacterium litoralis TaxID=3138935 RepID=UPI0032EAA00A